MTEFQEICFFFLSFAGTHSSKSSIESDHYTADETCLSFETNFDSYTHGIDIHQVNVSGNSIFFVIPCTSGRKPCFTLVHWVWPVCLQTTSTRSIGVVENHLVCPLAVVRWLNYYKFEWNIVRSYKRNGGLSLDYYFKLSSLFAINFP